MLNISDIRAYAANYFKHISELMSGLDLDAVERVLSLIVETYENGRKIIFMGNGGSAATSQHFANDFGTGIKRVDRPYRALSISDNSALITAIGNDYGYEEIFVRQLKMYGYKGDLVIAISASGNSQNLVEGVNWAKENEMKTVGLLGFSGGKLLSLCDESLLVKTPDGEYGPVEDIHMIMDHLFTSYLNSKYQ